MQYSYKARLANPVIILVMMAVAGAGNAFEQVKSDRGLREELGLAPDAEVQLIRVTLEKIHDKALAEKLLTGCVERIKDGREWSVEVIGLFDIDYDSRNWHLDQPDEIRELCYFDIFQPTSRRPSNPR